jgi:hypothetical protein
LEIAIRDRAPTKLQRSDQAMPRIGTIADLRQDLADELIITNVPLILIECDTH